MLHDISIKALNILESRRENLKCANDGGKVVVAEGRTARTGNQRLSGYEASKISKMLKLM